MPPSVAESCTQRQKKGVSIRPGDEVSSTRYSKRKNTSFYRRYFVTEALAQV